MFPFLRRAYLKRYLRMNAIRKGLLGGQNLWRTVFVLSMLGRFMGKVTKRGEAPVVFSESLSLGDGYELVHIPPEPTRRQAKKAARAKAS